MLDELDRALGPVGVALVARRGDGGVRVIAIETAAIVVRDGAA